jgi:hypothetical protein
MLRLVSLGLLVAAVAGDFDFTSCEKGSTCPAWISLLANPSKTITIEDKVKGANAEYYRIHVTGQVTTGVGYGHEAPASVFKFRRYSEFDALKTKLGPDAPGDFPEKLYFNSIVSWLAPDKMDSRRTGLETWFKAVLNHEVSYSDAWADELFLFLDPKSSTTAAKAGIVMLPDANKICNEDIHYFGIDVGTGEAKVRVWRRYRDFYAFYEELATLGLAVDSPVQATFPPKIFWNKFIKMWESKLEERRRGLESWLQEVKMLDGSAPGGVYAEALGKFLDPEHNKKKIGWDCLTEETAQIAYSKIAELYNQTKSMASELYEEYVAPQLVSSGDEAAAKSATYGEGEL